MKLNRLETHDRLQHFIGDQSHTIWQGAEDCLKKNPDSLKLQEKSPYIYIFAHPRTADDGVTKKMLWQPRLTKPKAQTNSFLFRAESKTDRLEICWLIPPRELWEQYGIGKVCESDIVLWSINEYQLNRAELERPDPQDLSNEKAAVIWQSVMKESIQRKKENISYE